MLHRLTSVAVCCNEHRRQAYGLTDVIDMPWPLRSPNPLCHITLLDWPTLSDITTLLCVVMPKPATGPFVYAVMSFYDIHWLDLRAHAAEHLKLTHLTPNQWQVAEKTKKRLIVDT